MKRVVWLSVLILAFITSCEEELPEGECGSYVIVSDEYATVISDPHMITDISVNGQCLAVEITSGGCDGKSWGAKLYASPLVAESYPPQVSLKIAFEDEELCEAAIARTFFFDLEPLNTVSDKMFLHLDGWEDPVLYVSTPDSTILGSWNLININGGLMGLNANFDKGEIIWTFDFTEVTVVNNSGEDVGFGGFESGTYPYTIGVENNEPTLIINDLNLGSIDYVTTESLIVDQREVDGFQYVLNR